MHELHECHLEGSGEHLGASCGPSGGNLNAIWRSCGGLLGASWEPSNRSLTLIDATAPGHAMKVDKHATFRGIAKVDHPDVSGPGMLQAFYVTQYGAHANF